MAKKKRELTLMSPIMEQENLPEEYQKILDEEQNTCEREDIDFLVEEMEENLPKMKIKEVKYGFSVLTNIGNFENIRTQIEVSAEIEENEDLFPTINALSKQIKDWGRREYKDIKQKSMATMPK